MVEERNAEHGDPPSGNAEETGGFNIDAGDGGNDKEKLARRNQFRPRFQIPTEATKLQIPPIVGCKQARSIKTALTNGVRDKVVKKRLRTGEVGQKRNTGQGEIMSQSVV
ncbi:hypothetical protein C8J56DRAFT_890178 [Mycena floridula]|nr:hypothetical protein C8J56DRAFT_890178 [Mycena floridula]